jgi:predicted nucleic acid-binding protein
MEKLLDNDFALCSVLVQLTCMRDVLALALTSRAWFERLKSRLPTQDALQVASAVRFMPEFAESLAKVDTAFFLGLNARQSLYTQIPPEIGLHTQRICSFNRKRHSSIKPAEAIERLRKRRQTDIINRHLIQADLERLKRVHVVRLFETLTRKPLEGHTELSAGPNQSLCADIAYAGDSGRFYFNFDLETKRWRCRELHAFGAVHDVSVDIVEPRVLIRTA